MLQMKKHESQRLGRAPSSDQITKDVHQLRRMLSSNIKTNKDFTQAAKQQQQDGQLQLLKIKSQNQSSVTNNVSQGARRFGSNRLQSERQIGEKHLFSPRTTKDAESQKQQKKSSLRDLLGQAMREKLVDKMQEMGLLKASLHTLNQNMNESKNDKNTKQILDEIMSTMATKKRQDEQAKLKRQRISNMHRTDQQLAFDAFFGKQNSIGSSSFILQGKQTSFNNQQDYNNTLLQLEECDGSIDESLKVGNSTIQSKNSPSQRRRKKIDSKSNSSSNLIDRSEFKVFSCKNNLTQQRLPSVPSVGSDNSKNSGSVIKRSIINFDSYKRRMHVKQKASIGKKSAELDSRTMDQDRDKIGTVVDENKDEQIMIVGGCDVRGLEELNQQQQQLATQSSEIVYLGQPTAESQKKVIDRELQRMLSSDEAVSRSNLPPRHNERFQNFSRRAQFEDVKVERKRVQTLHVRKKSSSHSIQKKQKKQKEEEFWRAAMKPMLVAPFEQERRRSAGQARQDEPYESTIDRRRQPKITVSKQYTQSYQPESSRGSRGDSTERDVFRRSTVQLQKQRRFSKDRQQSVTALSCQSMNLSVNNESNTRTKVKMPKFSIDTESIHSMIKATLSAASEAQFDENRSFREEDSMDGNQTVAERKKIALKRIEQWRQTEEFKRLGPTARQLVEDNMLSKGIKHSETYYFLNDLADKADIFWTASHERIPFFQKHFEERKLKKELLEKIERMTRRKSSRMNESIRRKQKRAYRFTSGSAEARDELQTSCNVSIASPAIQFTRSNQFKKEQQAQSLTNFLKNDKKFLSTSPKPRQDILHSASRNYKAQNLLNKQCSFTFETQANQIISNTNEPNSQSKAIKDTQIGPRLVVDNSRQVIVNLQMDTNNNTNDKIQPQKAQKPPKSDQKLNFLGLKKSFQQNSRTRNSTVEAPSSALGQFQSDRQKNMQSTNSFNKVTRGSFGAISGYNQDIYATSFLENKQRKMRNSLNPNDKKQQLVRDSQSAAKSREHLLNPFQRKRNDGLFQSVLASASANRKGIETGSQNKKRELKNDVNTNNNQKDEYQDSIVDLSAIQRAQSSHSLKFRATDTRQPTGFATNSQISSVDHQEKKKPSHAITSQSSRDCTLDPFSPPKQKQLEASKKFKSYEVLPKGLKSIAKSRLYSYKAKLHNAVANTNFQQTTNRFPRRLLSPNSTSNQRENKSNRNQILPDELKLDRLEPQIDAALLLSPYQQRASTDVVMTSEDVSMGSRPQTASNSVKKQLFGSSKVLLLEKGGVSKRKDTNYLSHIQGGFGGNSSSRQKETAPRKKDLTYPGQLQNQHLQAIHEDDSTTERAAELTHIRNNSSSPQEKPEIEEQGGQPKFNIAPEHILVVSEPFDEEKQAKVVTDQVRSSLTSPMLRHASDRNLLSCVGGTIQISTVDLTKQTDQPSTVSVRKETQDDEETYMNLKVAVNNGNLSHDGDKIGSPLSFSPSPYKEVEDREQPGDVAQQQSGEDKVRQFTTTTMAGADKEAFVVNSRRKLVSAASNVPPQHGMRNNHNNFYLGGPGEHMRTFEDIRSQLKKTKKQKNPEMVLKTTPGKQPVLDNQAINPFSDQYRSFNQHILRTSQAIVKDYSLKSSFQKSKGANYESHDSLAMVLDFNTQNSLKRLKEKRIFIRKQSFQTKSKLAAQKKRLDAVSGSAENIKASEKQLRTKTSVDLLHVAHNPSYDLPQNGKPPRRIIARKKTITEGSAEKKQQNLLSVALTEVRNANEQRTMPKQLDQENQAVEDSDRGEQKNGQPTPDYSISRSHRMFNTDEGDCSREIQKV